ncbi:MAG TPA: hypothetical protein VKV17_15810 [Bryobacteraceae bacterium]|nr:hypothetical protein [Bryobacteraceae bacterium]
MKRAIYVKSAIVLSAAIAVQLSASLTNGNHQLVATSNGVSSPTYTLVAQQ